MARFTLVLAVVVLALLAPSSASAAWLPIQDLGSIEQTDSEMRMAANDRGDAVVVWKDSRGIQAAVSPRGATFEPARVVPGTEAKANRLIFGVDVLVNEDGRALIHWRAFNTSTNTQRIYVAGMKVDGGFGTTRPVTPASPYVSFEPAIGPGGRFAFAYALGSRQKPTYFRAAPPSGKLGPRRTIATGGITVRQVWYPGARPYLAYTVASQDHSRLWERRGDPVGSARLLARLPRNGSLTMDTASNGVQAAVWTTRNSDGPARPLVAAVRRPGRAFSGQEIDNRLPPQYLAVAVAPSGAAFVAWRDFNESSTEGDSPPPQEGPRGRIVTTYRAPGRSFAAKLAFRPDPEPATVGGLNADIESDGTAVLGFGAIRNEGIVGRPYVAVIERGGAPAITPIGEVGGTAGPVSVAIDEFDGALGTFVDYLDDPRVRAMRGSFQP